MNKIKAVIFDMDGVLIDAKDWHYEALNKSLSIFGFNITRYEHLVSYDGLPTKKKLEMLTMEKGLPAGLHSFINEMKQRYTMDAVLINCKPEFAHQYALTQLKSRGTRLALASNSIRTTVDAMLEKADLKRFFELTLSNEDVKKAKPDPEIYNTTIQKLNLSPVDCLVVEDNENGIKAATSCGAHVLAVRTVQDVNWPNILKKIDLIEGRL